MLLNDSIAVFVANLQLSAPGSIGFLSKILSTLSFLNDPVPMLFTTGLISTSRGESAGLFGSPARCAAQSVTDHQLRSSGDVTDSSVWPLCRLSTCLPNSRLQQPLLLLIFIISIKPLSSTGLKFMENRAGK